MMNKTEALTKLDTWFKSGEAAALIGAYRDYHVAGTYGTDFQTEQKPAVIGAHGVLLPDRFAEYMGTAQTCVSAAVRREEIAPQDVRSINFLRATLSQMYSSVTLPGGGYPSGR